MFEKEYVSARIKAMNGQLLNKEKLESLNQIKTSDEFISALHKSAYEKNITSINEKTSTNLNMNFFDSINKISAFMPKTFNHDMKIIESMWDFENLKTILYTIYAKKDTINLKKTIYPKGIIYETFIQSKITSIEELGNMLKNTNYYESFMIGYTTYKNTKQICDITYALQKQYFNLHKKTKTKEISDFFKTFFELEDFQTITKLKKRNLKLKDTYLYFPKKTDEIKTKYEKLLNKELPLKKSKENYLLKYSKRKIQENPFSFFLVIDYMIKKRQEILHLQSITRGVIA
ncbi:hypothetical protein GQ473_04020 [archaeon]|nr:hypothetical protein [archaeon]